MIYVHIYDVHPCIFIMYILQVYIGKDVDRSFFFLYQCFFWKSAGGGAEQCSCSCCKQKDTHHYVG